MPIAYSYVRFSTREQADGDSERRQDKAAKDYCKKHGLVLDKTLNLRDLGVSSYHGKNLQSGALGHFLTAVDAKRVASGSLLLIENFDRLSRDQIGKSIELLLRIVNAGITLVTLHDEAQYNSETINASIVPLMISLVNFDRAHQEVHVKGGRISEAWKEKQSKAAIEKLTARGPLWLELSGDRKQFLPIPDRVAVIKKIFAMTIAGHGKRAIVRFLNKTGVKVWAVAKRLATDQPRPERHGWHESYIQKILHNRAVLGEYQPHERKGNKRFPVGEPVLGYFPAVIDQETFNKVDHPRFKRDGGRASAQVTNLYTHLVFCGFTDLPMRYIDKGTKKRGGGKWKYLHNAGQQHGLPNNSIHYATFEKAFLSYVRHLDWGQLEHEATPSDLIAEFTGQIATAETQLAETRAKAKRLVELVTGTDSPPKTIIATLNELEAAEDNLTTTIRELKGRRTSEETSKHAIRSEDTVLGTLAAGKADYDTRLRLQQEIRSKIKRITIWGRFSGPSPKKVKNGKSHETRIRSNPNPHFEITFINGVTRHVNLPDFKTTQAQYTLEITGEQTIGENEPTEERKPKPFSKRAKTRAGVRDPKPAK